MQKKTANTALIAILGIVVVLIGIYGFQRMKNASAPVETAGEEEITEPQVTTFSPEGMTITATLAAKTAVTLKDVALCQPAGQAQINYDFGHTYSCVGENCMTVLNFNGKPIPSQLSIYRLSNDTCVAQVISNPASLVATYKYVGQFTLTQEMLSQMQVSPEDAVNIQTTPTTLFKSQKVDSTEEGLVYTLEYFGEAPLEDSFLVGTNTIIVKYMAPTVEEDTAAAIPATVPSSASPAPAAVTPSENGMAAPVDAPATETAPAGEAQ